VSSDPAANTWGLALSTSRARVHLLRGEPARAEALMQAVEAERGALDAHQRMVLGDALAARSDVRLAQPHWQRALEDAHPESRLAEQLRRRLASSGA
jgi:Tfp pilus assembly protein PilF